MNTRVTEILGIRYPIIQGGLAHIATGAFAAAVSNAGALGQITATSLDDPADLRREVAIARARTTRPFGINLAIGHRPLDPFLDIALELQPTVISLTGGNPAPYIPRIKEAGIRVMVLVGSTRQAEKAEALGADIIIAVGQEGGGHIGRDDVGSLVLTRRVVESVRVPVVASGGFADGYGLLAALALGAEGIEMGTRFLATEECPVHPQYKEALLAAAENETTVIGRSIGAPGRVLPGRLVEEILRREQQGASLEELLPLIAGSRNRLGALSGDLDHGYVWAGQGVGLIRDIPRVAALVERIMDEARSRHDDLGRLMR